MGTELIPVPYKNIHLNPICVVSSQKSMGVRPTQLTENRKNRHTQQPEGCEGNEGRPSHVTIQ